MSTPRKRKGSPHYWYDFTINGHRYRGSTETSCLTTAKSITAKLRADILQEAHFGKKKESYTVDAVFGRYIVEYAMHLKSFDKSIKAPISLIVSFFGKHTPFASIGDNELAQYVANRRASLRFGHSAKDKRKRDRLVSPATINREISTFRKAHSMAKDVWGIAVTPIQFTKHLLPEAESRVRWESPEVLDRIIQNAADHLPHIIRFHLYTGARKGNVLSCRVSQCDFINRTITFYGKSNKPGGKRITVPMVQECYDMLLHEMRVLDGREYLFSFRGQPIKDFKRSWKTACTKAGVKDYRIHDLRHTCASWLVQHGVPVEVVKNILGHSDIRTTLKYAHHFVDTERKALESVFASQLRHNSNSSSKHKKATS